MTQDQSSRSWRRWVPLGGGFILKPQLALVALLLWLAGAGQAGAAYLYGCSSGYWSDTNTWSTDGAACSVHPAVGPTGSDVVRIRLGTITVNADVAGLTGNVNIGYKDDSSTQAELTFTGTVSLATTASLFVGSGDPPENPKCRWARPPTAHPSPPTAPSS
jgi:hypothetical protein